MNFESHPGKPLYIHTEGVLAGTKQRSELPMAHVAALWHDIGKLNPNFHDKLCGKSKGYSNHAHLSMIAFINCAIANMDKYRKEYDLRSNEDFALFVLQVSVLIAKHHGHLPDLEFALNSDELDQAKAFAQEHSARMPAHKYLTEVLKENLLAFDLVFDNSKAGYHRFTPKYQQKTWKQNPLKHFMDVRDSFAALIESDKRDAGDNKLFYFLEAVGTCNEQLKKALNTQFTFFENAKIISELNSLRSAIRKEAVYGIKQGLERGEHVFTLTAPTGAGKTFALLAIANEIQKQKDGLGIIYALPFLSITEQVQEIAGKLVDDILAVNSKVDNKRIDDAQREFERNPSNDSLDKVLREDFIQQTFDHPFIITTFVQFFESLVSNRNSTMLKLPNFANRVYLIDEVQALPPRLYIFFTAWIDEFCRRHHSYAILSTATMPNMETTLKDYLDTDKRADLLFRKYTAPKELIDPAKYFKSSVFNRYMINVIQENLTVQALADHILNQEKSVLVILNTIADTRELFEELRGRKKNVLLLNTHFIPDDRKNIIAKASEYLEKNEHIILISTQLIEAGVDIDFPIVYRDMCPLPSLIQSAGRCNRNKKMSLGQVYFFSLISENSNKRANLIYRDEAKGFLDFCRREIQDGIQEKYLFEVQSRFFNDIKDKLSIGEFKDPDNKDISINMIECVNKAQFDTLGKFRLINNNIGEQCQFYIQIDDNDGSHKVLQDLLEKMTICKGYKEVKNARIAVNKYIKSLSGRILNIRVNEFNRSQMPSTYLADISGIKFITSDHYTETTGLKVGDSTNCFM